jgi:hypothetical protein
MLALIDLGDGMWSKIGPELYGGVGRNLGMVEAGVPLQP